MRVEVVVWERGPRYQGEKKTFRARELRKDMTLAETKMWYLLRSLQKPGLRFRRQVPFGPYFLDFYCSSKKLVIELDGSQHMDSESDRIRDEYLKSNGLLVLRYWNNKFMSNQTGVISDILRHASEYPHPASPLQGEENI